MKLGMVTGYSGAAMGLPMEAILEAERAGFDSVWTAEAYGSDAVVPLAWIGALTKKINLGTGIMQMPARTPAMTAMTAMTLDALSGGRLILGLGLSGPQVVEGWHGVPYGKPLTRTREYVQIVRKILARETAVEFQGKEYQIPYTGPGSSGLGKPLRSILHGRADLPIYTASINPKAVTLAAEIADGLIPVWMSPERFDLYKKPLEEGFAKTGGKKSLANFEIAPFVQCHIGNDLDRCRMPVKGMLALYIGGMGARSKNFYNDYAKRLGYEDVAVQIQDLYLGGKRDQAMALVPDKLVDQVALIGPKERIKDRLAAWKASPVKSMLIGTSSPETIRTLAELAS
ncbi:MAG TPA: LLM class F420-dependent oxidoreductase [Candidatus Binataceae bacterium]|nr:LLM class F420-dependent oxidoreductase [Candidatus Binataceae bacterium]